MTVFKRNLKTDIAKKFLEEFSHTSDNSYYLFLSKIDSWPTETIDGIEYSESNPRPNVDSSQENIDSWRNCFFAKRILGADVKMFIKKYFWSSGEIYSQYSHKRDNNEITSLNFTNYVITEDFNVYKCISNNSGAESTEAPSGKKTTTITTSDGYVWKYMFTLNENSQLFITPSGIPLQLALASDTDPSLEDQYSVQVAAVRGSFEKVNVLDAGSPYKLAATASYVVAGASEDHVQISPEPTYYTDGYHIGYTVRILTGDGQGQIREITATAGAGGTSGYFSITPNFTTVPSVSDTLTIVPTIKTFGDGAGLEVTPNMNANGNIESVDVISAGSGYTKVNHEIYPPAGPPYNFGTNFFHRGVTANATGATTSIEFVTSPTDGHGADARTELGSEGFIVYTSIEESDMTSLGITAGNDFRRFGIIKNPKISSDYSSTLAGKIAGQHVTDQFTMTVANPDDSLFSTIEGSGTNLFQDHTFFTESGQTGTYIIGSSSLAVARVLSFSYNSTTRATLTVERPKGDFTDLEELSWFNGSPTGGLVITTGQSNIAKFISLKQSTSNLHLFDQTVRMIVGATNGANYESDTFSKDALYKNYIDGISGASFLAMNWHIGATGTEGSGTLTGVDYLGVLTAGDLLYDSAGVSVGVISSITGPDLQYNSGEVLYIQNIRPISRTNQQAEEIKIQIEL